MEVVKLGKMDLGQAERLINSKCRNVQLFVLHSTTTWRQSCLSRGFIDNLEISASADGGPRSRVCLR
jgi:hypothetical protein